MSGLVVDDPVPSRSEVEGPHDRRAGDVVGYMTDELWDADAGEWAVTGPRFRTAETLYLANQDIWAGNWGGDFYQGHGVSGQSHTPE